MTRLTWGDPLVAFGFEEAFGFDGGFAAGSGGGDGLALGAVLNVAGMEDAERMLVRAPPWPMM